MAPLFGKIPPFHAKPLFLFFAFCFFLSLAFSFSLPSPNPESLKRHFLYHLLLHRGLSFTKLMDFDFPVKRENEVTIEMDDDVMNYQCGIELDLEFWPVEHPVEPEDEDRPVKCPMPISSSSVIKDEKTPEERKQIRPDPGKERPETAPTPRPIRVVRKRHHAFAAGSNSALKPTIQRGSPLQPRDPSGESSVKINLIEFGS